MEQNYVTVTLCTACWVPAAPAGVPVEAWRCRYLPRRRRRRLAGYETIGLA